MHPDAALVAAQIGRPPRSPWRVAARCSSGWPTVIASPPRLDDGSPFPTLFWLTCPWLAETVSRLESAGETDAWAERLATDAELRARAESSDAVYRRLREDEGLGDDPCASTGVAGQRTVAGPKCLHAYVAAALAGVDDPIGADVLGRVGAECGDRRCEQLGAGVDVP